MGVEKHGEEYELRIGDELKVMVHEDVLEENRLHKLFADATMALTKAHMSLGPSDGDDE